MSDAVVVVLGASHVTAEGVPLIQAVNPIGNSNDDVEPFGEVASYQVLGVTSLPWPTTKEGHAEGLVIVNVGGHDAVLVGARDLRTAKIVGKMGPGDTVLHSTGPEQAAQVQLKEKKRQVVLATKDSSGETMMVILDGKNDAVQIVGAGHAFKMSRKDGISLVDSSGKAGIQIKDGVVSIFGALVFGGRTPDPAFKFMLGPATGSPGAAASTPMIAAPGISLGR